MSHLRCDGSRSTSARGYTLIEVMLVVAIVGLLAAMATYGIGKHLNAARISEAKEAVGHISRSAHGAYQEELAPGATLGEGTMATKVSHALCESATPVPSTGPPKGTKYQPNTANAVDFQSGSATAGWTCLRFNINHPIIYQYHYTKGDSPVAPTNPAKCPSAGSCYEAGAIGNVDGDADFSRVVRTGFINTATAELKEATQLYVDDEPE